VDVLNGSHAIRIELDWWEETFEISASHSTNIERRMQAATMDQGDVSMNNRVDERIIHCFS